MIIFDHSPGKGLISQFDSEQQHFFSEQQQKIYCITIDGRLPVSRYKDEIFIICYVIFSLPYDYKWFITY